jgi:2'-hydroxyisoflavone reductase
MDILILGGTVFLGRALVAAAQEGGHRLTLFNRGRSNPGLFPSIEHIQGDRASDLARLEGRRWDAVIDTCGYVPRLVRASARALKGAVGQYTFISSLSVYADTSGPGVDESGAVGTLADPTVEEVTGGNYGPLKALCEQVVAEEMGAERSLLLRPGLIVGPYDSTDRFSYWPWRVSRGGEVLAPGRPERLIQWIDVRDLAECTLRMLEAGRSGAFNATGPGGPVTMKSLLETCRVESNSDAAFTWTGEEYLLSSGVTPWTELPLWVPESDPESAGFFSFSNQKAVAAGLSFRPLRDTVRATLLWLQERPAARPWRAGLAAARESELLQGWHSQPTP